MNPLFEHRIESGQHKGKVLVGIELMTLVNLNFMYGKGNWEVLGKPFQKGLNQND